MSYYGRNDPRKAAAAVAVALALAAGNAAHRHHGHHHGPPPAAAAAPVAGGGSNEQLANRMAAARGWGAGQQHCLDSLWTNESGFSATVWNHAGSGAYGIPQALPADKMAAAGPDWQTNPATQIKWGLGYIGHTYGSPCSAWSFWLAQSPHWY